MPALAILLALCAFANLRAQVESADEWHRVFLTDGRALPSYGESAHVGDRIAFVLPIGDPRSKHTLQLVSLPASAVDLNRTMRYSEGVRARSYALTRGPSDYSTLMSDVQVALAEVERDEKKEEQLRLAAALRARLVGWPATHYNYRAADLESLLAAVDLIVDELRRELGRPAAAKEPVKLAGPFEPAMPRPTTEESLDLARAAADATNDPLTRQTILALVARLSPTPLTSPDASRTAAPGGGRHVGEAR